MTFNCVRVKTVQCPICQERFKAPEDVFLREIEAKIKWICKPCAELWDDLEESFYENDTQYIEYLRWTLKEAKRSG
jgi:hypothetical protein